MFRIKATGKNTCYGKKGEIIDIGDNHLVDAIREGWVEGEPKFLGLHGLKASIKTKKVAIMPEKRIYVINELRMQTTAMNGILKRLDFIEKKRRLLLKLLKKEMKNA